MANIAVLLGSPRKGGNTETLVEAFVSGVDKQRCSVNVISVIGKTIHGCIGCNHCYRNESHDCAFKDDMQAIYTRLAQADTIVIATPIYFYGVSSQLKCVIDRLHNPIRNAFRVKRLALLSVCADDTPNVFDSVMAMYRSVLEYFSLDDAGVVTVCGVEALGDIAGNEALDRARALGEKISALEV